MLGKLVADLKEKAFVGEIQVFALRQYCRLVQLAPLEEKVLEEAGTAFHARGGQELAQLLVRAVLFQYPTYRKKTFTEYIKKQYATHIEAVFAFRVSKTVAYLEDIFKGAKAQ